MEVVRFRFDVVIVESGEVARVRVWVPGIDEVDVVIVVALLGWEKEEGVN